MDPAQALDHLSLINVAHNLHYQYEEGGLNAQNVAQYAERLLRMIGYPPDELTTKAALETWQRMYPGDRLEHVGAKLYHWTDVGNLENWLDPAHTGPGETYLTSTGEYGKNPDVPWPQRPVRLVIDTDKLDPEGFDKGYSGWHGNELYRGAIPQDAILDWQAIKPKNLHLNTDPSEVNGEMDHWPEFGEYPPDENQHRGLIFDGDQVWNRTGKTAFLAEPMDIPLMDEGGWYAPVERPDPSIIRELGPQGAFTELTRVYGLSLEHALAWIQRHLDQMRQDPTSKMGHWPEFDKVAGLAEYAEMVPIDAIDHLRAYDRRPNGSGIPGEAAEQKYWDRLKQHISEHGFEDPLTLEYNPWSGKGYLGEGNHRLQIAKELGMTHVPLVVYRRASDLPSMKQMHKPGTYQMQDERGFSQFPQYVKPSMIGLPTAGSYQPAGDDWYQMQKGWEMRQGKTSAVQSLPLKPPEPELGWPPSTDGLSSTDPYGSEEDLSMFDPDPSALDRAIASNGQIPDDQALSEGPVQIERDNPQRGVTPSYIGNVNGTPVYIKPAYMGSYYTLIAERAAYMLAHHMGIPVPRTVIRDVNGEPMQVQEAVPNAVPVGRAHHMLEFMQKYPREARQQQLFDDVIGNTDRHLGNVVFDAATRRVYPIDHGFSFDPDKYTYYGVGQLPRDLMGEHANPELTPEERASLERIRDMDLTQMGLGQESQDAFRWRVAQMLDKNRLLRYTNDWNRAGKIVFLSKMSEAQSLPLEPSEPEEIWPSEPAWPSDPSEQSMTPSAIANRRAIQRAIASNGQIPGDYELSEGPVQIERINPRRGVIPSWIGNVSGTPVYIKPAYARDKEDYTTLVNERAAYMLAHHMGVPVPRTVVRDVNNEPMQVQEAVPNAVPLGDIFYHTFDFMPKYPREVRQQQLFDDVIGNTDRHLGNTILDEATERVHPIDHGFAFNPIKDDDYGVGPMISKYMGEHANPELTPEERASLERIRDMDLTKMGLEQEAQNAFRWRVAQMLDNNRFLRYTDALGPFSWSKRKLAYLTLVTPDKS